MMNEPKSDDNSSATRQWDIDRYLLADSTLDREQFERQMLNDPSLAQQVAKSVLDLQLFSLAADRPFTISHPISSLLSISSLRSHASAGKLAWGMLATAATLLIVVSAWQFHSARDWALTSADPSYEQLAQLADNWLAFEESGVDPDSHRGDELMSSESNDSEASEQSDWLVEAAREFYQANNEGAAG